MKYPEYFYMYVEIVLQFVLVLDIYNLGCYLHTFLCCVEILDTGKNA